MIEYPNGIQSKLPAVGTTIFTTMSAMSREYNAVNLSQGFPDFEIDERLRELTLESVSGNHHQYAPMQGLPKLRSVLVEKLKRSYNIDYDVDSEITVTAGATQAIYTAISAFIKEDDEVIIFTPAYDCYAPAITLNGGKPIYCQLTPETYSIDWEMVKKLVSNKTKMIIINTPHNPTGAILSASDLKELEKIVVGNEIIVLSDEVYEHIIFDGKRHESVCLYPDLAKQSMAVYSFGKTFHVTGWKLGFIVGPEALMREFRKVHQFNVFCCSHPLQEAVANYIDEKSDWNELGNFYQAKRDMFVDGISSSRFELLPCSGTYFQLLSYKGISEESDVSFAERLTKEFGVASIPVSVFFNNKRDDKVLRFCFAKKEETLASALELLNKI